jgi:REP element-mobilizing transposase RayT
MARPLRIEYPGALYHVVARGNAKQPIFLDRQDHRRFLRILECVVDRHNVVCLSYCMMGNHYHLLLETPDGNLSRAMRQLNGVYSQGFNRRHQRVGHLFQGRYKAILVERGVHLLELSRYIVLNPVRAELVTRPEDWEWSSYRETVGVAPCPRLLSVDGLLGLYGSSRSEARERYRSFVEEASGDSAREGRPKTPTVLGTREFVLGVGERLGPTDALEEIPRAQRFLARPDLDEIFQGVENRSERNRSILTAFRSHGYTMKQIADAVGIHYSTVSRVIRNLEQVD